MAGKQAKVLTRPMFGQMIKAVGKSRHPTRNKAIILLSVKAGLRASEIAKLTWPMVLNAKGEVSKVIELHNKAAKNLHGRTIPMHPELQKTLLQLLRHKQDDCASVIVSERGESMQPSSIVNWFQQLYFDLNMKGCSSHSGRRSFVTQAARKIHLVGGSLKDVQQLAGHRSLETTQAYIEGDSSIQRRLIARL
jgi:integrase